MTTMIPHDPVPVDTSYGHHVDCPHWPGTLYDCPACVAQRKEEGAINSACPWGEM